MLDGFDRKKALLFAIIALAIIARVFALLAFPDSALNDGILHLYMSKSLTGTVLFPEGYEISMPPPLQHFALAYFFSLSGLEWRGLFLKIVPFALSLAFLAGCFLLFRKALGKLHLLAFAFVAVNPWLIIYFSINYTEAFAATAMVFAALFALKFFENPGVKNAALLGFCTACLGLSKLNATFVAVAFALSVIGVSLVFRKGLFKSAKALFCSLSSFVLFSAAFPLAWFAMQYLREGFFVLPNVAENFFSYPLPPGSNPLLMFFKSAFSSSIEFWGYPSASIAQNSIPSGLLLPSMGAFFLMVLPLTLALAAGFFLLLRKSEKRPFMVAAFVAIAANIVFVLTHGNPFLSGDSLYWRYFIPVLPLAAIPLAVGFEKMFKGRLFAGVALASLVAFSAFSLCYSSYFALHFNSTHAGYEELYSYLDTLPEGSAVFTADLGRQVSFFSKTSVCPASTWNSNLEEDPKAIVFHSTPEGTAKILKESGCTHVVVTSYYREAWSAEKISELLDAGVLEKELERPSFVVYSVS